MIERLNQLEYNGLKRNQMMFKEREREGENDD
jgi:hypothetical protein